jgi:signal transduction histidine kinase
VKEKNIKLTYSYEKDLPKVNVDKLRISSVIQMLLENAIAYTKDKIDINIKKDKNNVIFSIKDNGIGIPKQDQPYVFNKFFRTHQAYLTETEGSGISLFLSKSIIDKHNGKIGVYSEGEGKGSEFWFKLKVT